MPPPPPSTAGPPEPRPPGHPLAATGEQHQGTRGGQQRAPPPPPPSPLPLRSTDSPRSARGTAAPQPPRRAQEETPPPREGSDTQGRGATAALSAAVRRVPPIKRPSTPAVPAAGRQPSAGAQEHPVGRIRTAARGPEPVQRGGRGTNGATRLGARLGRAERRTEQEHPPRNPHCRGPPGEPLMRGSAPTNPPPAARLTQQRPARPRLAPGADKQHRPSMRQGGMRGAEPPAMRSSQGRGPWATAPGGEWQGTTAQPPPSSPPASPPPARGMPETGHGGARALAPPKPGEVPPPAERAAAPGGGMLLSQYATRPHAPTRLLPQRPQQAGGRAQAHKGVTRTTHRVKAQTLNRSSMEATPSRN